MRLTRRGPSRRRAPPLGCAISATPCNTRCVRSLARPRKSARSAEPRLPMSCAPSISSVISMSSILRSESGKKSLPVHQFRLVPSARRNPCQFRAATLSWICGPISQAADITLGPTGVNVWTASLYWVRRICAGRHQSAPVIGQRCAGLSSGSVGRKHQIAHYPWRTSLPLRPCLGLGHSVVSPDPNPKPPLLQPRSSCRDASAQRLRWK